MLFVIFIAEEKNTKTRFLSIKYHAPIAEFNTCNRASFVICARLIYAIVLPENILYGIYSFIDADWQFSNMLRVSDNTGYERICLTASVRVSESENYNLIDRAKAVSRKGLQIIDVDADTSIPSKQISEAESDLRVELIQRASAERVKLSKAAGRNYRVHSMLFSSVGKTRQVINNPATKMAYGTGFDSSEDGTLGNAAKLTMNASVKLAVIVENDHDKQAQEWRKDFGLAATGN